MRINRLYHKQRSFNTLIWKYYVDNGLEKNDESSDDDESGILLPLVSNVI
jgi:hypothetical protein